MPEEETFEMFTSRMYEENRMEREMWNNPTITREAYREVYEDFLVEEYQKLKHSNN